jgi:hypothetical protein
MGKRHQEIPGFPIPSYSDPLKLDHHPPADRSPDGFGDAQVAQGIGRAVAAGFAAPDGIQERLRLTPEAALGILEPEHLADDRLESVLGHPRLNFARMDIRDDHALIERLIADADVVLPLAAYAGQPTTCAPPPATAPG